MFKTRLIDRLDAYFKPIAKNIGSKSGFCAPHRTGFRLESQLKAVTYTSNNGIKLIVIVEHIVGYQKYVVSHALQSCHAGGVMIEHRARAMNDFTLNFDDYCLHKDRVYDDNVAVTYFLACYLLRRNRQRR